jgi:formylglycine-generating enzyme required for sulfatase activity
VHIDTFSVGAGRLNEVFIDLLYAVDAEKEKREKQARDSVAAATAPQQNLPKPAASAAAQASSTGRDKEQATIAALVANMVPVSGGSFVMGNNKSPSADEAEHGVLLNPLFFGKHEVTQEQWKR